MRTRVFPAHAGLILESLASSAAGTIVFPAHAGLIPIEIPLRDLPLFGIPRSRGVDSAQWRRHERLPTVFPAHAGLIPCLTKV